MSSPLEAPEQANNDRKQLILKQRARIDPLTAPENMTKGLLDLPAELLIEICTLVFGDKVRVNINVLHRRGSSPSRQFMNALPAEMSKLDGLLKCSRATRNYAYIVLGRQVLFDANSINFTDLPLAFGKDNCLRMHRLDLYAHFEVKTGQDSVWTDLLQMFVRDLSNLVYFELWSVHDQCRPPYPESESRDPEGSVSRHNQECRSLMQFAAYLINLHPKLDRLIKDALDGPTYKEGELKVFNNYVIDQFSNKRPWQSRTSFTDESRTKKETIEDEILNAPLIRRLNPTVLANKPTDELVVKPRPGQSKNEMTEDDVPKQNLFYAMVDERAFRSAAEHNAEVGSGAA